MELVIIEIILIIVGLLLVAWGVRGLWLGINSLEANVAYWKKIHSDSQIKVTTLECSLAKSKKLSQGWKDSAMEASKLVEDYKRLLTNLEEAE